MINTLLNFLFYKVQQFHLSTEKPTVVFSKFLHLVDIIFMIDIDIIKKNSGAKNSIHL